MDRGEANGLLSQRTKHSLGANLSPKSQSIEIETIGVNSEQPENSSNTTHFKRKTDSDVITERNDTIVKGSNPISNSLISTTNASANSNVDADLIATSDSVISATSSNTINASGKSKLSSRISMRSITKNWSLERFGKRKTNDVPSARVVTRASTVQVVRRENEKFATVYNNGSDYIEALAGRSVLTESPKQSIEFLVVGDQLQSISAEKNAGSIALTELRKHRLESLPAENMKKKFTENTFGLDALFYVT
ncbi:hypothetical protein HK100_009893 [Physocladia obscura]|uniref:Uncharacterized protein n=1 Tax=Physocladia obscura TaxID=109957 RepID=A0AAD5XEY0_9FUNG|nr:hypothetical protein HK100_009893 [Physocladia obscura]